MSAERSERRRERRTNRVNQPRDTRRTISLPRADAETIGRYSEDIARFFGTARYLMIQTLIVLAWIAYNGVETYRWHHDHSGKPFDPYPFILLNLAFSTQAAYAAPLILLAQNRQADRDRVQYDSDRAVDERNLEDTEFLAREVAAIRIALGEVATRDYIRGEIARLLEELTPPPDEAHD